MLHFGAEEQKEQHKEKEVEIDNTGISENTSLIRQNSFSDNIFVLIMYASIVILTIVIPKLKIIFHIVGSTAGNFISFILPNLFYIILAYMARLNNILFFEYLLLIFGFIFLVISLVVSLIKAD